MYRLPFRDDEGIGPYKRLTGSRNDNVSYEYCMPHNCAALPLYILHKKGETGLLESVVFSSLTNVFA